MCLRNDIHRWGSEDQHRVFRRWSHILVRTRHCFLDVARRLEVQNAQVFGSTPIQMGRLVPEYFKSCGETTMRLLHKTEPLWLAASCVCWAQRIQRSSLMGATTSGTLC